MKSLGAELPSVVGGADPRGSLWRRWDPHIHAPGTALADQFKGPDALDRYLISLEIAVPAIEAIGVTDYLGTGCYEQVRQAKSDGRLPGIGLIFPNIELRLSIGTKAGAGVNLHLLVSPEDAAHLEEIHRFLSRLSFTFDRDRYLCTREDLVRLGQAHDPAATTDQAKYEAGVGQFKVDFNQLREELQGSEWMKRNSLIALAGGGGDGSSGLRDDTASFAAQRREIESFADIIFAASESQVDFWLGRGTLSLDQVKERYRGAKPCLHGSDAHRLEAVGKPDLDRYCWIKGDTTFESLVQASIEPEERAFIGASPPTVGEHEKTIQQASTIGLPWFLDGGISINPGLVAIIGSRGSGKTALADLLAHGAGCPGLTESDDSFVHRAAPHLGSGKIRIDWQPSETSEHGFAAFDSDNEPDVHYLSQQFVERLCSAEGTNDELIDEIQKVVFAAHDPSVRLGTTTFDELLELRIGDKRLKRQYLRDRLDRVSEEVLAERTLMNKLPTTEKARAQLVLDQQKDVKAREGIVSKGEKERSEFYTRLRDVLDERQRLLQELARRRQNLDHLTEEIERHESRVFPDLTRDLHERYNLKPLTPEDWDDFAIQFRGVVRATVETRRTALDQHLSKAKEGTVTDKPALSNTVDELRKISMENLQAEFETVSKEIGVDRQKARQLQQLNERIAAREIGIKKLDLEIERCKDGDRRMKELIRERTSCYEEFFEMILREQAELIELYTPLETVLEASSDSIRRLKLVVVRTVDVQAWAGRGENLLDLRKVGKFKGRGSLASFASEKLVPAWRSGSAKEVSEAMAAFRTEFDQAIIDQGLVDRGLPEYPRWTVDVGRWLYSTDHIQTSYSFEYDGMPLSQLSPGMRGIVLLLLYLALDLEDRRPLIIDQPEENLDPRSVYTELVSLFRLARYRRQVIMVTHNANLVVNTDVDQVIVASCTRGAVGKPPTFQYVSGGLENPKIRADVCEILEGGEAAFRDRARRLRVHDL